MLCLLAILNPCRGALRGCVRDLVEWRDLVARDSDVVVEALSNSGQSSSVLRLADYPAVVGHALGSQGCRPMLEVVAGNVIGTLDAPALAVLVGLVELCGDVLIDV